MKRVIGRLDRKFAAVLLIVALLLQFSAIMVQGSTFVNASPVPETESSEVVGTAGNALPEEPESEDESISTESEVPFEDQESPAPLVERQFKASLDELSINSAGAAEDASEPSPTPSVDGSHSDYLFDSATGTIIEYTGLGGDIVIPDKISDSRPGRSLSGGVIGQTS